MQRYLENQIQNDLNKKMVFLGGPRQVGKTTLSFHLLKKNKLGYLNWDDPQHREQILKRELPKTSFLVFDEIHKYKSWRNYLKGLYDSYREKYKILVTGSARLDLYRFGGDSLQGRYYYLRLHQLSAAELKIKTSKDLNELLQLGGFPEPFLSASHTASKRWSREYRSRLIQEDITKLENIQDIGKFELGMIRLPSLVGSPLSINSLREDLEVSHKTVAHWLNILERLYAIFRLPPFGAPKIRAVKKEQKHYHYDWTLIEEEGLRFENMIACHLMKWVHYQQDVYGEDFDLRYFRDIDGREIDFVIIKNQKPVSFIECKLADKPIGKGLKYLKERFPLAVSWQISLRGKKDYETPEGHRVCPAIELLKDLV